jgi:signal transduction histidine kinase
VQGIIGSEEFRAGGRMDLEYRIARPDTDVRWVRSRTFPVLKAGRLARLAGVTEDITPFKLAEEHLRRAKDQAEEAARAKTRFLASMSHEVKTPLNGVLGMLQVLGMGRLDAEQREHVAVAEGAAQGLLDLINDILDYSRLEEGQAVIAPQDFRVEDVLRGVIETFRGQAERKGIALSFAVDPSVPEMVRSDPGRLRQILFNLVGNAIKFTEKGFVRVEVCFFTAGRADGARNLLFSVLDSGKGIEPDKLDYIFEAFAQADESYARRHRGPGLGLAIVRRLVGFLGGALSVESEEGNGTAVHFSINVRPACVPSCPLT